MLRRNVSPRLLLAAGVVLVLPTLGCSQHDVQSADSAFHTVAQGTHNVGHDIARGASNTGKQIKHDVDKDKH